MMIFFALSLNPAAVLTDPDCGAASFFAGSDSGASSGTSVSSILAPHSPQKRSSSFNSLPQIGQKILLHLPSLSKSAFL